MRSARCREPAAHGGRTPQNAAPCSEIIRVLYRTVAVPGLPRIASEHIGGDLPPVLLAHRGGHGRNTGRVLDLMPFHPSELVLLVLLLLLLLALLILLLLLLLILLGFVAVVGHQFCSFLFPSEVAGRWPIALLSPIFTEKRRSLHGNFMKRFFFETMLTARRDSPTRPARSPQQDASDMQGRQAAPPPPRC